MPDERAVPPTLAALQHSFWALITAPTGVSDAAQALPQHAGLLTQVRTDARASASERLDIYANMYFYRLRDNLADDFPKLRALLGEGDFHNLVTDYLHAHPSQQPSARYVGQCLADFVQRHALSSERPWLFELAALEWARVDLTDRADQPVLTLDDLQASAQLGFGDLTLQLVAAHARLTSLHEVETVWRALAHEQAPGAPAASETPTLLIWRQPDLRVHHRRLTGLELRMLPALAEPLSFVALCELLVRELPAEEAAREAVGLLASLTRAGLLAKH